MNRFLLSLILLSLINFGCATDETCHWSYDDNECEGPSRWGLICNAKYSLCKTGKTQSPINVEFYNTLAHTAAEAATYGIDFKFTSLAANFTNNNHSIEVDCPDSNLKFVVNSVTYKVTRFHFHVPAEYTYDGEVFDASAHFVGQSGNQTAVVAQMFRVTPSTNSSFLNDLIPKIPVAAGASNTVNITHWPSHTLTDAYYTLQGSLTTPPCTEGITWFLYKQPEYCTAAQLQSFKNAYSNNARPVQSENRRTVTLHTFTSSSPSSTLSVTAFISILIPVFTIVALII